MTYRNGYPDFSPHLYKGKKGEAEVTINMTGDNAADFRAANKKAGFGDSANSQPDGYTWHHNQDGKTMQLVKTSAHDAVPTPEAPSAARAKGSK